MTSHIRKSCGFSIVDTPTITYEDNAACVAQMQTGYIKNNMTKHISPKFFYTHELQKEGKMNILQVQSCDNLADLFTKSLPDTTYRKCIHDIGVRELRDQRDSGEITPEYLLLFLGPEDSKFYGPEDCKIS
jgi:hypothetical protein